MLKLFKTENVTDRIIRITDVTHVSSFLAIGEKEALLVDTGTGTGNIKDVVAALTDKPLKVLLTHGHVDHAFGAQPFEDVYMSHLDADLLKEHGDVQMRLDYANNAPLPEGERITEDMLIPAPRMDKIKDLKDGDSFDLGGLTVEVHALPGHTAGSMTVLFKEDRVLLTGDACNTGTWLFLPSCPPLETYYDTLLAYRNKLADKFDKLVLSHGNDIYTCELLDIVIETCKRVLDGTDDAVSADFMGMIVCNAAATKMTERGPVRIDGKFGNITYNPKNIFRPKNI